jgi:hypothetical protein
MRSHCCLCVFMCIPPKNNCSRQQLGKSLTEATIEELLNAYFPMRLVSYERKGGDPFFSALLIYIGSAVRHLQVPKGIIDICFHFTFAGIFFNI